MGKSAAIEQLVSYFGYAFVTTYTTRAPRISEIDGRDYFFLTRAAFQQMVRAGDFIDWDYFLSSYGGIGRQTFLESNTRPKVLHVLARMALRLEQRYPDAAAVFLVPEDVSVIYDRIRRTFHDPDIAEARCRHVDEEILHSTMSRRVVTVARSMTVMDVAARINLLLTRETDA